MKKSPTRREVESNDEEDTINSNEKLEKSKDRKLDLLESSSSLREDGSWIGVCLDDGTGRNIVYHDLVTGKVPNLVEYWFIF